MPPVGDEEVYYDNYSSDVPGLLRSWLVELAILRRYQKQVKTRSHERSPAEWYERTYGSWKMNPEARYSLWGSMTNVQKNYYQIK